MPDTRSDSSCGCCSGCCGAAACSCADAASGKCARLRSGWLLLLLLLLLLLWPWLHNGMLQDSSCSPQLHAMLLSANAPN
jgi:hypothetical protein